MKALADLMMAVIVPPASSWLWWGVLQRIGLRIRQSFVTGWFGTAAIGAVLAAPNGDWPWAAGSAVSAIVALAVWWWRRKRRQNALAVLGAKARAARDALVRKAREAAQPRPVLRPAPQGAR